MGITPFYNRQHGGASRKRGSGIMLMRTPAYVFWPPSLFSSTSGAEDRVNEPFSVWHIIICAYKVPVTIRKRMGVTVPINRYSHKQAKGWFGLRARVCWSLLLDHHSVSREFACLCVSSQMIAFWDDTWISIFYITCLLIFFVFPSTQCL